MQFVVKNPFASNQVDAMWPWYQAPGIIGDEGIILSLHS
jgi:hypothetical protein